MLMRCREAWETGGAMGRGWLVLSVKDEDRTHGSNDGYADQPDQHYLWDDTVPNHARLAESLITNHP